MKVCLIDTNYTEYMIELANALSRSVDVTLFYAVNAKFSPLHREQISPRVRFEPFHTVFHNSIKDGLKMWVPLLTKIWLLNPDVLHVQDTGHHYFYHVVRFINPNTTILDTIHDPLPHSGDLINAALDRTRQRASSARKSAGFFVHGEKLKEQLGRVDGIEPSRINCIPVGNLGIYKNLQRVYSEERPVTFLFFGRIWPYKGLDTFVEAAIRFAPMAPQARFHIVGRGQDLSSYLERIRACPYRDQFHVVNELIPVEEVGKHFQEASVVVLPYKDASQSGIIPVAYTYRKPVIATRVGSLEEAVLDGMTGLLIEPDASDQLCDAMQRLYESPSERRAMGESAHQYSQTRLSWDRVAELTCEGYERAIRYQKSGSFSARLLRRVF